MVKCVFCGKEEDSFRGLHLMTNIGEVNYYCSSKCRKNAIKLGRDKRKFKWTEAHGIMRNKTIEAEARDALKEKERNMEDKKEEKKSSKK